MMEARVTHTHSLPKELTSKVKEIFKEFDNRYDVSVSLYNIKDVSEAAEAYSNKAKSIMDQAMKGWTPKTSEISWQIFNAMGVMRNNEQDLPLEVTYNRVYIK